MAHTPEIKLSWLSEAMEFYFQGVFLVSAPWQLFADSINVLEPQDDFRFLNEHLTSNTFLDGDRLTPADLYVLGRVRLCPAWKRVITNKNRPPYLARWYLHVSSLLPDRSRVVVPVSNKVHPDLRLHTAILARDLDLATRLLRVVDVYERNPNNRGMQAIHVAAFAGYLEGVKLLIQHGVPIESEDSEGMTALFYAAHGGHALLLTYLAEQGANASHIEGQGRTALYWAANAGKTEVLKLLMQLGCDPNAKTRLGRSALSKAAWSAQTEVVRVLCECPTVKLDDQDTRGRTPLHNAVWGESGGRTGKKMAYGNTSDSPECAEIIIQHMKKRGMLIDLPDKDGNTPLSVAASTNAPKSVILLLAHGANPTYYNYYNNTPLHEAIRRGHLKCSTLLLEAGVDPNISGFEDYSPLQTAVRFGQVGICRYLLSLPAVVLSPKDLYYSIECRQGFMLKLILEKYPLELPSDLLLKAVETQDEELIETVLFRSSSEIDPNVLVVAAKLTSPGTFAQMLSRISPKSTLSQEIITSAAANSDQSNLVSILRKVSITPNTFLLLAKSASEASCLSVIQLHPELWSSVDVETGETALHRACFRGLSVFADHLLKASGSQCCIYISQTDNCDLTAHMMAVINRHNSIAAYLEDIYQQSTQKRLQTRVVQLTYIDVNDPLPENPIPEEQYPVTYPTFAYSLLPLPETSLEFLDKETQFTDLEATSKDWKAVGVDLEYFSFDQHRGVIALVQLSDGRKDYILDPLRCPEAVGRFMAGLMKRSDCIKVMHGADSDLTWLQLDFSAYATNVFDTARAHKTLTKETDLPSLARLLQSYLRVPLDKSFQIADWRIRPLPAPMLTYAREDAHYLLELYTVLVTQMNEEQLRQTASLCTKLCRKHPSNRHQRISARLVSESTS